MSLTWRFVADLAERVVWTFLQAYFGFWLATGAGWDTLFTLDGLKVALTAAALVVATTVVRKPIGNPDSASVLPPEAQPPAPQPPEEPKPSPALDVSPAGAGTQTTAPFRPPPYVTAAVFSARLNGWSTVYLHTQPTGGTFTLTSQVRDGFPVAEYRPDRTGTHSPLGPEEMGALNLRVVAGEAH